MTDILIRQRYREEFDGLSLKEMEDRINVGLWSGEQRVHAIAYVDEKLHGEDRAHKAEQLRLASRADRRGVITTWIALVAIVISLISLAFSLEPRFRGRAAGLTSPPTQTR